MFLNTSKNVNILALYSLKELKKNFKYQMLVSIDNSNSLKNTLENTSSFNISQYLQKRPFKQKKTIN